MKLKTRLGPWVLLIATAPAWAASNAPASEADADAWPYRIVRGDTLIALQRDYLRPEIAWQRLQRANRIADPRRLRPGSELRIPMAWLQQQAALAEVLQVQGEVQVQTDPQAALLPAQTGMQLAAGTRLQSTAQASVLLRFADGSRMLVSPGSELTLSQLLRVGRAGLPHTRVQLQQGRTESTVQPAPPGAASSFQIRSRTATLAVRGTEFRVATGAEGQTLAEVTEGRVLARVRSSQMLQAGFGSVARPGAEFLPAQRLLPAPQLPVPADIAAGATLSLAWPAVPGAVAYRVRVLGEGTASAALAEFTSAQPELAWQAARAGRYQLRVRAIDALGLEGADATQAVAVQAASPAPSRGPAPPFPTVPASGSQVRAGDVTFRWSAIEPDRRYRLQVADEPGFGQPLVDITDTDPPEGNQVQRTVRLLPGRYYWRLASIGAVGESGEFSALRAFEVVPAAAP